MNGPLISVIIVFRDVERFLDEAVGSVLGQDWPHWELLLVDDCSADRSTAIARRYAESHPQRIRYLDHPGHAWLGIPAPRNAGVSAARGEYLERLDHHMTERGSRDPRVARAVRRALVEFRHPNLWALRQAPGDAMRWLRAVGYAMLPDVIAGPVRTAWRRHKQRRTDRLLERARRLVDG